MIYIKTFEQYLFKINEDVYGNKATVYHRTKLNNDELKDIFLNKKWNFGSNAGSLYGDGLYTTYSLDSQMIDKMINAYGSNIIKFSVNLNNFLILNYKEFKKTSKFKELGSPIEIDDNGELVFIYKQLQDKGIKFENDFKIKKRNFTSEIALYLIGIFYEINELFDGIVYTGSRDGNCLLIFEHSVYNNAIPIGWYKPINDATNNIDDYQYINTINLKNNKEKELFTNNISNKLNIENKKTINISDSIKKIREDDFDSISNKLWKNSSFCKKAVTENPLSIKYVDKNIENYAELCKIAVSIKSYCIRYVDESVENYTELCKIAVIDNNSNLIFINTGVENYKDLKIIHDVINDPYLIKKIDKNYKNYAELCKISVSKNKYCLEYVDKSVKNYAELCVIVITENPYYLVHMDKNNIKNYYELCEIAVTYDSYYLEIIPKDIENYYTLLKLAYQKEKQIIDVDWFPNEYLPNLKKDFPNDFK